MPHHRFDERDSIMRLKRSCDI